MKKFFTLLITAAAFTSVSAQTSKTLYEDANAPMLSWSAACNITAAQVEGIQQGDQFVVTVNARQEGNEWPKFGFEVNGESLYPAAFEMWGDDKTFPLEATYTLSEADAELLANGFEIKGDGVQITKVVYVQNKPEELPEGQIVLFNDPNAPMLSWSAACNVTAAQVEGIQAGDQFVVTVNARQEGNDWPKFGFEVNGESLYPTAFEMWGDDKTFPLEATYTLSEADAELLANGFEIKGDGVQITKVVLIKADNVENPGEEEPGEEEPGEEPDDEEGLIYYNPESGMLSWSTLCNVTPGQVEGLKAGDSFIVTVNAVQEGNEWPKFGFEVGEESLYPEAFEMWGDDKTFPLEATYTLSEADAELLANGFEIKGDGVQITKVVLVREDNVEDPGEEEPGEEEPGEEPDVEEGVIYYNPESEMLSWSTLCSVTEEQVEGLKAGDSFVVTVKAVQEGNEWPKFGFEFGEESLYPEAFEMWGDKTFPYEATYTLTSADAELLVDGFEIKGDGVQITKVMLVRGDGIEEPGEDPEGGDTSVIESVVDNSELVTVYSISGNIVRQNVKDADATNHLRSGLYIINGKKVLVR